MSAPVETIEVQPDEAGIRLDRWFKIHFPYVTYGYLQKLLRSGQVRVDSKRVTANARLDPGSQIRVPKVVRPPPPAAALMATGYPNRSATMTASSTVSMAPSLDGVVGTRAALASSCGR